MYVFFDVDGTLLSCKSMVRFQDFYLRRDGPWPRGLGPLRSGLGFAPLGFWQVMRRDRFFMNRAYYRTFRGRAPDVVRARASEWFEHEKRRRPDLWIASSVRALEEHRARGHQPVLVSGSMVEILEPIARELGVAHALATRLVVHDGRYTGEIDGPQMLGPGKAEALRAFLAAHGGNASECFAYGDHISDVPMLEAVGHAVVVGEDPELTGYARQRRWTRLAA
jgi:HAD superfamily hydrolase (TIGR01490 family)